MKGRAEPRYDWNSSMDEEVPELTEEQSKYQKELLYWLGKDKKNERKDNTVDAYTIVDFRHYLGDRW
jgi:hypothetical protein